MKKFIPIANLDELSETEGKAFRINNLAIALFKAGSDQVFALENSCPHIGAPLDNGLVQDKTLTCLWHGWCFDLETGHSSNCPGIKVQTYTTKIEDNKVWIEI